MWKSKHHIEEVAPVPDAEQIARYMHLVELLPASVTMKAHAAAFTDLSVDQRAGLLESLRPSVPDVEVSASSEQPEILATLVGDVERRDAMMRTGLAAVVASRFVRSAPVAAYFTVGVGSVTVDDQPPWVSELAHHESVPIDVASVNHHSGIDFKVWR
jgi:hypothetical protein